MEAKRFRKKPVVVEAIQLTEENKQDVCAWVDNHFIRPVWQADLGAEIYSGPDVCTLIVVKTLEGEMRASSGDWIIRGVEGEFYPCRKDIFEKTYEEV